MLGESANMWRERAGGKRHASEAGGYKGRRQECNNSPVSSPHPGVARQNGSTGALLAEQSRPALMGVYSIYSFESWDVGRLW